jgi:hypothetical protein
MRVASAQVQNDIASFSAGLIYGSEVCKYRELPYDVLKLLRGRQGFYSVLGIAKEILESSPKEEGDPLHREMYKSGVTNLEPYYPCPHCAQYQTWDLQQIIELPDSAGYCNHDPERIRQTSAARYECAFCGCDITEPQRMDVSERVVWAAKTEKIGTNGTLLFPRTQTSAASFQWPRRVDISYTFAENLARFLEAERCGNPVALKTFYNEDEAQFYTIKAEKRDTSWLLKRCLPYKIADDIIPNGVIIVLCGIDTQDNGFYFILRGFGAGKESWLLDTGFIACDMTKDPPYEDVVALVRKRITKKTLVTSTGRHCIINAMTIDRGGHMAQYVDQIAAGFDNCRAYIGSKDKLHPLAKLGKDNILWGNTQNLSKRVGLDAEKDNWHLPEDIPQDYLHQFVKQYQKEETDRFSNTTYRWIHGGKDHLRDCENYIYAALVHEEYDQALFDATNEDASASNTEEPQSNDPDDNYFSDIQDRYDRRNYAS